MEEGVDYYINENGLYVFTEVYLSKRGYCCRNSCKHCPFGYCKQATPYFQQTTTLVAKKRPLRD